MDQEEEDTPHVCTASEDAAAGTLYREMSGKLTGRYLIVRRTMDVASLNLHNEESCIGRQH